MNDAVIQIVDLGGFGNLRGLCL